MSVMKKEEILNEHIWVMPLHAIFRVLDKLLRVLDKLLHVLSRLLGVIMNLMHVLLLFLVYIVAYVISFWLALSPIWILILLVVNLLPAVGLHGVVGFSVFLVVICVAFVITKYFISSKLYTKIVDIIFDKLFSFSWHSPLLDRIRLSRHINPNLSGRFLQHYEKRWGMTNEDIKDYISHRAQLGGDVSISHLLPFVSQLCQLNKNAREEQEMFLSNFLGEDEIEYLFNMEYSYSQMEQSYQYWRGKEMGEKKSLMELLFKFTIEQDGIHNDEWKMLMQIMAQLKFNSRYIEYFKDRYYSLRTEFDDYERKSTSSLGGYSFASLEPYYAILELKEGASIEEIKRAYHKLAMQHHPDLPKNANRIEECEAKMMEINEAYEKVRG